MIYLYWVSQGLASLHKMRNDGNDVQDKPKKLGKYKTDTLAKEACKTHFEKACKMAIASGNELPTMRFF